MCFIFGNGSIVYSVNDSYQPSSLGCRMYPSHSYLPLSYGSFSLTVLDSFIYTVYATHSVLPATNGTLQCAHVSQCAHTPVCDSPHTFNTTRTYYLPRAAFEPNHTWYACVIENCVILTSGSEGPLTFLWV